MIYDVYFIFATLRNKYTLIWFNKSHTDRRPRVPSPPLGRPRHNQRLGAYALTPQTNVAQEGFQEGGSLGQTVCGFFV